MKKLVFMMACLVAMALASCSTTPSGPTGDVDKDAKAAVEKVVKIIEDADFTNLEAVAGLEKEFTAVQKEYEDFYKAKGDDELAKFNEALEKAGADANIEALMEKKQKEAMKALGVSE